MKERYPPARAGGPVRKKDLGPSTDIQSQGLACAGQHSVKGILHGGHKGPYQTAVPKPGSLVFPSLQYSSRKASGFSGDCLVCWPRLVPIRREMAELTMQLPRGSAGYSLTWSPLTGLQERGYLPLEPTKVADPGMSEMAVFQAEGKGPGTSSTIFLIPDPRPLAWDIQTLTSLLRRQDSSR